MSATSNNTSEGFRITGNWNHQAKLLQVKFPQLTEADLNFEIGQEINLIVRIQHRLNLSTEEVIAQLLEIESK